MSFSDMTLKDLEIELIWPFPTVCDEILMFWITHKRSVSKDPKHFSFGKLLLPFSLASISSMTALFSLFEVARLTEIASCRLLEVFFTNYELGVLIG